jgi:translation initiation factor 2 subunit 2
MTEEEAAFDPTMKKKKKKKTVDLEDQGKTDEKAETAESAEQPDVDSGVVLDAEFGKKKKKKKPAAIEEDKPEEAEVATGNQGVIDAAWPDYSYEDLLTRVFNIMREKNPDVATGEKKKFKLSPPQVGRAGSKKTAFANFPEICKQLKRTPKHLLAFLLAELGTSGSVDGNNQLIIKGRFQQKHIESVLRKYIKEYVTCHTCHSAETELQKDTRLFFLQCSTCGSRCSVAAIKSGYQAVTTRRAQLKAGTQT